MAIPYVTAVPTTATSWFGSCRLSVRDVREPISNGAVANSIAICGTLCVKLLAGQSIAFQKFDGTVLMRIMNDGTVQLTTGTVIGYDYPIVHSGPGFYFRDPAGNNRAVIDDYGFFHVWGDILALPLGDITPELRSGYLPSWELAPALNVLGGFPRVIFGYALAANTASLIVYNAANQVVFMISGKTPARLYMNENATIDVSDRQYRTTRYRSV